MRDQSLGKVFGVGHLGHMSVQGGTARRYKGTSYEPMCPSCPKGHIGRHFAGRGDSVACKKDSPSCALPALDRALWAGRALFSYNFLYFFLHGGFTEEMPLLPCARTPTPSCPEHYIPDAGGVSPAPLHLRDLSHPQDAAALSLLGMRGPLSPVVAVTREVVA